MKTWLLNQWRELIHFNSSDRPLELPVAAALASGLPLFVGAYFGRLEFGLVSSLGGMAFLYLPPTRLAHRMIVMLCISAVMTGSFLLGLVAQRIPYAQAPMLFGLTLAITYLCRLVQLPPPGTLFLLMPALLGAYTPLPLEDIPYRVGLLFMGALLATVLAAAYSVLLLIQEVPIRPTPALNPDKPGVFVDALVIASFTSAALLLAQCASLSRPYWVPFSCLVVMQGVSFQAVWSRQLHRIVGTALGLVLTWRLLSWHLGPWWTSAVMLVLNIVIETLVVRHYALAMVFITPLTILLAEAGSGGANLPALISARLVDTVVGSLMGLIGGFCLHQPRVRAALTRLSTRFQEKEA